MPPKRRRASPVPEGGNANVTITQAATETSSSKDIHQLTVAELKTLLTNAGVTCDKFKRKSEYVAAAESLGQKNANPEEVVTIPSSDDDQSAQAASKLPKPSIVIISSSDDEEVSQSAPVLSVARSNGRAFGGNAAAAADRKPVSQSDATRQSASVAVRGGLMFDPVFDANGDQIEVDEDYRESNDVLYGG